MVFQNYALFPHLSVRRNVAFGLAMRGVAKRERGRARRRRCSTSSASQPHAEKYPAQLSGGQQQRVAIARAVVMEPSLVLMDEPLSNLDAKLRLEMRTEIRRLHQQLGLTTVYVTHDQEEALSLADRLVAAARRRRPAGRPPEELYPQPASALRGGLHGLPQPARDGGRRRRRRRAGHRRRRKGFELRGTDRRDGAGRAA